MERTNMSRILAKAIATGLLTGLAVSASAPAIATSGEILINQGKALAGNVTPGEAPGFPVTLSRLGAYGLTGGLQVPPNKDGIAIAAESVTLDVNGFQLTGRAGTIQDAKQERDGTLLAIAGRRLQ
jgi:hypothetical protein